MFRRLIAAAAVCVLAACEPSIKNEPPTEVIEARFDPSAAPPVIPTPNDLATDPKTGLLVIPIPAGASGADRAFYSYLSSLNGYPTTAGATATFDGNLDPASVSAATVKVFDVTANHAAVTSATPGYSDVSVGVAKGQISVAPPATGWTPGHTYAVALLGGSSGLKGASASGGKAVVSSATFAFLRAGKSLVTCSDLTSPDCQTATEVIPSAVKGDPAKRLADQTKSALQLEQLRLKYKPTIDTLISAGQKREDIVLVWHFRIADFTQMTFDPAAVPPKVPVPNDLAIDRTTGLVKAPIDPSYSDAYKEFITDYLNTLDGFPVSSKAQVGVTGGDLDPNTVDAESVLVVPLDGGDALDEPTVSWNPTTKTIDVAPPNGSWGKGRQLAVVVLGRRAKDLAKPTKPPAVERVGGGAVVASSVWALVRSPSPLVDCDDLTAPDCALSITAAPLTLAQALQLEALRRLYAPALDGLEGEGITRDMVAILWTFRTVSLPEATFDPSASIIPFPNNALRTTGANPHLQLPAPPLQADGGISSQGQLVQGLNTLDGFSTTAPIVSESSATRGALDIGAIDPATLADGGTGFLRLGAGAQPQWGVCVDCKSSAQPDGGANTGPEQLQFYPTVPLAEQSTYGAFLTSSIKDLDGHRVIAAPTFALTRLNNALCDANMHSTVPVLSDEQACGVGGAPGLEQLRAGLKPFVDVLVTRGVSRKNLSLAWAFTTETTVNQLAQLAGAVGTAVTPPTAVTAAPIPLAAVIPAALPQTHLAPNLYLGTLTLPHPYVGPGGVILPPNNWQTRKGAYMLTAPCEGAAPCPAATAPAAGWPVVIFGHGLTSNRTTMVAIADTLAAIGYATVAIDVMWHGERSSCTGSASALRASIPTATDDYACASPGANTTPDPVNNMCNAQGRCVKRTGTGTACVSDVQCMTTNQGYCEAGFCEGADFARSATTKAPLIGAWNFLNLGNLFAARDNFRGYAIDLSQLVRVIKADAFSAVGGPHLDASKIQYLGMSLGGFNGALFGAVSPDVHYVMLSVPGADQAGVLLTSPGFAAVRSGFLGQLESTGIVQGTPEFDQLLVLLRTIFDPADPQNFGDALVNRAAPTDRKVFIQSITDDFVVPNPMTDKLIAAAQVGAKTPSLKRASPTLIPDPMAGPCTPPAGSLCASSRHSFLLNFTDVSTTAAAQQQAATFIMTGVVP